MYGFLIHTMLPDLNIADYSYPLEENRIAKYPLPERDASKLLVYKSGSIHETVFRNMPQELPEGSLMVFNDTRVVPARLHFRRPTGARIEIFCLEPHFPADYALSFASLNACSWKCVIGNSKRWKDDILHFDIPEGIDRDLQHELESIELKASLVERDGQVGIVRFSWKGEYPFSAVLELCGNVPIPPYLNRETESIDIERYQTLYARIRGSVAAPTAGLHFTDKVLDSIRNKGIDIRNVCLHVGAGTFLPVKSGNVSGHSMHRETFMVSLDMLKSLRSCKGKRIAVGTTSVRTLESLYYIGVKCIENGRPGDVGQWEPYEREYSYSVAEALDAIIAWLEKEKAEQLTAGTRIIIVPGFRFRFVDMMVTNFHQSESTLILLVAAFVGEDWRKIYDYALSHDFRFLSYGDSSLLCP